MLRIRTQWEIQETALHLQDNKKEGTRKLRDIISCPLPPHLIYDFSRVLDMQRSRKQKWQLKMDLVRKLAEGKALIGVSKNNIIFNTCMLTHKIIINMKWCPGWHNLQYYLIWTCEQYYDKPKAFQSSPFSRWRNWDRIDSS